MSINCAGQSYREQVLKEVAEYIIQEGVPGRFLSDSSGNMTYQRDDFVPTIMPGKLYPEVPPPRTVYFPPGKLYPYIQPLTSRNTSKELLIIIIECLVNKNLRKF